MDPERILVGKKPDQIDCYIMFKNKSLFWLIYMNNELINNKKKNHSFEHHIFYLRKKVGISSSDPDPAFPRSGSADPDKDQNYTDPHHCFIV